MPRSVWESWSEERQRAALDAGLVPEPDEWMTRAYDALMQRKRESSAAGQDGER